MKVQNVCEKQCWINYIHHSNRINSYYDLYKYTNKQSSFHIQNNMTKNQEKMKCNTEFNKCMKQCEKK